MNNDRPRATGDDERFGVSDADLAAERERHKGIHRSGMHIPTRAEVGSLNPLVLNSILDEWMWESPTLLIPTKDQIKRVMSVLEQRPDVAADEVQELLLMCRRFVSE